MSKYKIGDTVEIVDNNYYHGFKIGDLVNLVGKYTEDEYSAIGERGRWFVSYLDIKPQKNMQSTTKKIKSNGGVTSYYDMPYQDWVTTNDQMEYLAEHKWGKYAIHLKDIFKGLCRWGDKDGTTVEYDTRKIIYYGVRVLSMCIGIKATRKYLQELLDDKQFKEKK